MLEDMICKGEVKFSEIVWLDIHETGRLNTCIDNELTPLSLQENS